MDSTSALVGCFVVGCGYFWDSGGGGSGFVSPAATNITKEADVRAGNGLVLISYLGTPPNSAACKNGGWRNFVDDHGQPFPNQGQCVNWALHHTR